MLPRDCARWPMEIPASQCRQVCGLESCAREAAAWMEPRYVGHGVVNGPSSSAGPPRPPLAPPSRCESCNYFRDNRSAKHDNLHSIARKLSYFSSVKLQRSHPLWRSCVPVHAVAALPRKSRRYGRVFSGRSNSVYSCLGIHFRVGRKVKWTRLLCNWNSDISGVGVTPFT